MNSKRLIISIWFVLAIVDTLNAKRAPHVQFDFTSEKSVKFIPVKGTIECCNDSLFTTCDIMRQRYFVVSRSGSDYDIGWGEITPMHNLYPDIHAVWRVILYGENGDSLVSNVFRISNDYPTLSLHVSDKALAIQEEFKSVHKGQYFYALALVWYAIAKIICFSIFFGLGGITFTAFKRYTAFTVLLAIFYFAITSFLEWPIIYFGFISVLFLVECLVVKRYITPDRKTWVVILLIVLCSLIALAAALFKIFMLDFGE